MSSERPPSAEPDTTVEAGRAPAARRHRLLRVRAVLTVCALASTVLLTAACGDSCASTTRKGRSGGSSGDSSSCSGSTGYSGSYHNDYDDDDDYGSGSGSGSDDSSDSSGSDDYSPPAEEFPAEARPGNATQMLTVQLNAQYGPELTAWRKDAGGDWAVAFSALSPGDFDHDVPDGTYPVTTAFGNVEAPSGTTFTYRRVTKGSYQGLDLPAPDGSPLYGIVVDTGRPESTLVHGNVTPGDADMRINDTDMERVLTWLNPTAHPRIAFIGGYGE
ncbi:hypothetical protein [Streptomyces sp. CO7]